MTFMSKVFPEFRIASDLGEGIYGQFSQEDPTIILLNRNLFDMIEDGLRTGENTSHILYYAYVTIIHELGHWFNCAVSNFHHEIRLSFPGPWLRKHLTDMIGTIDLSQ